MNTTISLPDLPRALAAAGVSATYLGLWRLVISGDVPAHRNGGRWHVNAADLPVIAGRLRSSIPARG